MFALADVPQGLFCRACAQLEVRELVTDTSQTDTEVQADPATPAGRALIREEAIAAARAELPAEDKEQPTADVDGTDETEANESAETEGEESSEKSEETPTEGSESEESTDSSTEDEIDWSDLEQRTAELKRIADEGEDKARERLDNQKRSMIGEITAERARNEAGTAQVRQTAMLRELDELRESDPDAFTRRVTDDKEAAEALANRHTTPVTQDVVNAVKAQVVMDQSKQLFGARPELEQMAIDAGEEWQKATDTTTNGIFGYIARAAFSEGETGKEEFAEEAVEKFKKSAAYKDELSKAEQRGKQDALTESGLGSPPANDDSTPTEEPATNYDDPRQQAAADAKREMARRGTPISINPSDIPKRKRSAAR